MVSYKLKGSASIGRVISHVVTTVITLWVGGTILGQLGDTIVGDCSPFFEGLELIGWEVGDNATAYAQTGGGIYNTTFNVTSTATNGSTSSLSGQIDNVCEATAADTIVYDTGDSGVLSVIGLIGLAAIVLEFVEFKF